MHFRFLHIALLSCIFAIKLFAQPAGIEDVKFENYTPHNGLPSDFIEKITQDKYGFIWMGTHNGLIRFDGVQFKTYLHNNADSNSLPDNDTRSILADATGKVWITSRKGLFYYSYVKDNFIKVAATIDGRPIKWSTCPVLDKQKNFWFFSNAGICRMNYNTLAIKTVKMDGLTDDNFSDNRLFKTGAGNIWYTDNHELRLFDTASGSFQIQPVINDDGILFKSGIQAVTEEPGNKVWIASFFGLYLLNTTTHIIQKYPYQYRGKIDNNVSITSFNYCRQFTGDSILWCSTPYHGLSLFNLHTRKFIKTFLQDNYDESSLGGSSCYTAFTDRNDIVWISHLNGLSKLDWRNQQIKSYRIKEMVDSDLMMPVRKIIPDIKNNNYYWLITWHAGVLYYDKMSRKKSRHYQVSSGKTYSSHMLLMLDGLYDNKGTLWTGSEIGLSYYNPNQDKFISVKPSLPLNPGDTIVLRILGDNHHNLWLGSDNGLWRYNTLKKEFKKYTANNTADSSLITSPVYALRFNRQGKLYVGTEHGLFIFDTSTQQITSLVRPTINKIDFNINYVWGIDFDRNNNVWVTTRGGGLYMYNPVAKTYVDYKTGNGLTTDELRDVYVDTLQNVWVSSFDGIFKLDHQTKTFARFTPEDGLDNFNISQGRWSIIDNKIYSGSPGAYSIINPYTKTSLTNHFPVWITGVKILNRAVHFSPDSSANITVPVSHNENIIGFEFSAISYTASAKTRYAYMLEGFDKTWVYCGSQRFAGYNNLSGGSYTFKVRAMNAEGFWSNTIASIRIKVFPPFWKTWWFWLLVFFVSAGIVILLVRKRILVIQKELSYKQQQAVFKQKLAEAEMMALRAQMNPHFIFNCMNIIDGLVTDNRNTEALDFLQKFSKLIRLVLENSQYQLITVRQDLEALKLYTELEAIRSNHQFIYEFIVEPELLNEHYKIPPLLLQPFVENAIVHGLRHKETGTAKLLVQVKRQENIIDIVISDNGIGREKAALINNENRINHEHLGMKVTGKRIDLLKLANNKISVTIDNLNQSEEPGTKVNISLPVNMRFE